MSLEQNKAVVRRYYEEFGNQHQYEIADETFAPQFKMFSDSQPPYGAEGARQFMRWFQGVFPDLQATIDEMIAEGDVVAVRVTLHATQTKPIDWISGFGTIAATGKPVDLLEYQFRRVVSGKIVERRVCFDTLGMLYQLGAIGAKP